MSRELVYTYLEISIIFVAEYYIFGYYHFEGKYILRLHKKNASGTYIVLVYLSHELSLPTIDLY